MKYIVASTPEDIRIGMTRYDRPPNHGMLFYLLGRYTTLTMEGMKFPLHVIYYDQGMRRIGSVYAYPGDRMPMPYNTWYMLEVPYIFTADKRSVDTSDSRKRET